MWPIRADECLARSGTLAVGSNADLCKPAFADGLAEAVAPYFFLTAAPASAEPAPRIALKKSLLLSTTITSDFLLKLAR